MDINLTLTILGHAVGLHLCLDGGKVSSERDEHDVRELESDHEKFKGGFQPNQEPEDEDDEYDEEIDRSGDARPWIGRVQRWTERRRSNKHRRVGDCRSPAGRW